MRGEHELFYFCDGLESFEQNQTLKGFALPQPPLR